VAGVAGYGECVATGRRCYRVVLLSLTGQEGIDAGSVSSFDCDARALALSALRQSCPDMIACRVYPGADTASPDGYAWPGYHEHLANSVAPGNQGESMNIF